MRFCQQVEQNASCHVESEVHALLECLSHQPLVERRNTFLSDIFLAVPSLSGCFERMEHIHFLRDIMHQKVLLPVVPKYVHDVLIM